MYLKIKQITKKTVFLTMTLTMISAYVYAQAPAETGINSAEGNIYVAGRADEVSEVTLMLKNNSDELAAIAEVPVNDGEYEYKFSIGDIDVSEYTLSVRSDDTGEIYTPEILEAETTDVVFDIDAEQINGVYSYGKNDIIRLIANIKNKYKSSVDAMLVIAGYDNNGSLVETVTENITVDFDINRTAETVSGITVAQNVSRIKGFVWSTDSLKPAADKYNEEMKPAFEPYSENETVVAFYGDSLIYIGGFVQYVEEIYNLRYPGNNLTFLNKGIGGDTVKGLISRLGWDIVNDGATPKPDYIIVSVGYNDLFWANSEQLWVYNDYYRDYETLIDMCKTEGITPIIMGFSNYDRYNDGKYNDVKIYSLLADKIPEVNRNLKRIAKENDVYFIDTYSVMEKYIQQVRTQQPEIEQVFNILGDSSSPDRIHQTDEGKLLKAAVLFAEQFAGATVASVEIDGDAVKTINCDVTELTSLPDGVSYTYTPKGLPIAYTNTYKKIEEKFNVDLTNIVNREIIRISGLTGDCYSVSFDGVAVGTYSGDELAEGVNISLSESNPSQLVAKAVHTEQMAVSESSLRNVTSVRQILTKLGVDASDDDAVKSFIDGLAEDWTYLNNSYTYTRSDMIKYLEDCKQRPELWNSVKAAKDNAKAAAQTGTYKVSIMPQS